MRITNAKRKAIAANYWQAMNIAFPEATCTLDIDSAERLAIRGILSAQCTDERVNITAKDLFEKYPTMMDIEEAGQDEVAEMIKPCGLHKSKSKSVVEFAKAYCNEWNNEVPNDVTELMKIPGIGKKIANLIVGEIYGTPAIVVDTHCKRVMYRLGLTDNTEPIKVEKDLCKLFDENEWIKLGHLAVLLGRNYCLARGPKCDSCPNNEFCMRRV